MSKTLKTSVIKKIESLLMNLELIPELKEILIRNNVLSEDDFISTEKINNTVIVPCLDIPELVCMEIILDLGNIFNIEIADNHTDLIWLNGTIGIFNLYIYTNPKIEKYSLDDMKFTLNDFLLYLKNKHNLA